jgi:transcriptional regulator with XRE-family HTH domain
MSQGKAATRVCGACLRTRLSGYNPGTICGPCQRALFDQQHLAGPGDRDDVAAWVWDTGPMRAALARLDFPAVLVIYRSAARLSRRELGERTGFSESAIWHWEAGVRQGIYDIRQLLQFADAVQMPRPGAAAGDLGPAERPERPAGRSCRRDSHGGDGPWVTSERPRLPLRSAWAAHSRPGWPPSATRCASGAAGT